MMQPDYPARGEPVAEYVVTDKPEDYPGYERVGYHECSFHGLNGFAERSYLLKKAVNSNSPDSGGINLKP